MTELQLQKWQVIVGVLAVVIAIICGGMTVFTQILSPFLPTLFLDQEVTPTVSEKTNITFQVFDEENGSSIQYASVLLFIENRRLTSETDDTGTVQFRVSNWDERIKFDYVVQAKNYNIERKNNVQYQGRKIDVPLSKSESNSAAVFFIVTDEGGAPIPSAEVALKVDDTIIPQPTDSNGIAKFNIIFSNDTLGAQVSVNAKGFQPDYQNVTLLPNRILVIRLDPNSRVIQPPCYTETFTQNKSDPEWHVPLPPTGTVRQYINEEYQLFSQTKEGVHWSRSSMGFFTNYILQVEARWGNDKFIGQEYGLIFDRSGGNDETAKMYRFNINSTDGTYHLGRLSNGKWDDLLSAFSPDINPGLQSNVLKVVRHDDSIELYINGNFQGSYIDNTLDNRPARLGVNVVPFQTVRDGDARFDNFAICSNELLLNENN